MRAINTFDRIAPFYDSLQQFVFGNALFESQIASIKSIDKGSNVLMIAGGTGKVLEALVAANENCHVWYLEASSAMIARSKQRLGQRASRVVFIHGTEESIPADVVFDVVMTGFFLDLLPEEKIAALAGKVSPRLAENGRWLITDFVRGGKWWQDLLLWTMYRFFVLTCGIEMRKLPAWERVVNQSGFHETDFKLFYGDFVKTSTWIHYRA